MQSFRAAKIPATISVYLRDYEVPVVHETTCWMVDGQWGILKVDFPDRGSLSIRIPIHMQSNSGNDPKHSPTRAICLSRNWRRGVSIGEQPDIQKLDWIPILVIVLNRRLASGLDWCWGMFRIKSFTKWRRYRWTSSNAPLRRVKWTNKFHVPTLTSVVGDSATVCSREQ